jgi:flagellar biosynthesis protein FliR
VEFVPQSIWAIGLVFARVGALMMLAPGIGDQFVPGRVRLTLALFLSMMIAPIVEARIPALPASTSEMAALIGIELIIGLALGLTTRILFSALATAGAIAGMQTGLAMAMTFDPTQSQQGAVFGTFLALLGTAVVFQTNTHHWFLTGAVASYGNFDVGDAAPLGQIAQWVLQAFSQAFSLAIQMTAPLLLYGIIMNVALGIVNRVAPQIQVFFIAQPVQVLFGIALFMITAGAGMMVWLEAIVRAGQALNR